MAVTYNDLTLDIRRSLRQAGIEAATLEARELVCFAAGKDKARLLRDGALYASLCRRGAMRTLVNESQAHEAIDVPPHDTRAALRGRFIQSARSHNAQYSCDWTRLSLTSPNRMDVTLLDPFDAQPSDRFLTILEALQ